MNSKLIEIKNVKKYFPVKGGVLSKTIGHVKAVDDVSFYIRDGETLGLVGESGCGKSTAGRTILRLLEPTAGEVLFRGKNIFEANQKDMRKIRRDMQIIFQDPYESLNPRLTVEDIVGEAFDIHKIATGKEKRARILKLLVTVGLRPEHLKRYPHEFSGGQRQRIGIARALALNPSLVVCDEPVSALDVSIQAQVINLMDELQEQFDLTYLFISHDLRVIKHKCDRIAVMYLGKIVEMGDKDEIYNNSQHPYTKALLSSIPTTKPWKKTERIILSGEVPSASNPPKGCRFNTRCKYAMDICRKVEPNFKDIGNEHFCACHLYD